MEILSSGALGHYAAKLPIWSSGHPEEFATPKAHLCGQAAVAIPGESTDKDIEPETEGVNS
ncbi:MAG TPA: hypothetical protein VG944_19925 [Fimbriimonas sp.]|nr:hypothetical protein [Fimbriimonas sp.]